MQKKGFTLIELLVVVTITVILGLIFVDILIEALRGQNKVKAINQVKQNGQVVLEKLSNDIRQAEKIICIGKPTGSSTPDDTLVLFRQGVYTRYRLIPPTTNLNGYLVQDEVIQDPILPLNQYCIDNSPINGVFITDQDKKNGVSVDFDSSGGVKQPVFSKSSKAGFADTVTVRFKALTGIENQAYETMVKEGGIPFVTTVEIRGGIR